MLETDVGDCSCDLLDKMCHKFKVLLSSHTHFTVMMCKAHDYIPHICMCKSAVYHKNKK